MEEITNEKLEKLAKILEREKHREWQRNHKDKIKEYRHRYWIKQAIKNNENTKI